MYIHNQISGKNLTAQESKIESNKLKFKILRFKYYLFAIAVKEPQNETILRIKLGTKCTKTYCRYLRLITDLKVKRMEN